MRCARCGYPTCLTKLAMSIGTGKADLALGAHRGPELTPKRTFGHLLVPV